MAQQVEALAVVEGKTLFPRSIWEVHTRAIACASPTALILKAVTILLKISTSQSFSSC